MGRDGFEDGRQKVPLGESCAGAGMRRVNLKNVTCHYKPGPEMTCAMRQACVRRGALNTVCRAGRNIRKPEFCLLRY
jgi:hypothetical protein